MKTRTTLTAVAALVLLSSCSWPTHQDDFRLAQGQAMLGQAAAAQAASLAMAGQQLRALQGMRTIPVQPSPLSTPIAR